MALVTMLKRLGEETFGQKLARARTTSRVGLKATAELISDVTPISVASVSRLEDFPETPVDLQKRMLATLTVLVYGFEPEEFGLTVDDLPRSINVEEFVDQARLLRSKGEVNRTRDQGTADSRWITPTELVA